MLPLPRFHVAFAAQAPDECCPLQYASGVVSKFCCVACYTLSGQLGSDVLAMYQCVQSLYCLINLSSTFALVTILS